VRDVIVRHRELNHPFKGYIRRGLVLEACVVAFRSDNLTIWDYLVFDYVVFTSSLFWRWLHSVVLILNWWGLG
jgi:hypothetical protein